MLGTFTGLVKFKGLTDEGKWVVGMVSHDLSEDRSELEFFIGGTKVQKNTLCMHIGENESGDKLFLGDVVEIELEDWWVAPAIIAWDDEDKRVVLQAVDEDGKIMLDYKYIPFSDYKYTELKVIGNIKLDFEVKK